MTVLLVGQGKETIQQLLLPAIIQKFEIQISKELNTNHTSAIVICPETVEELRMKFNELHTQNDSNHHIPLLFAITKKFKLNPAFNPKDFCIPPQHILVVTENFSARLTLALTNLKPDTKKPSIPRLDLSCLLINATPASKSPDEKYKTDGDDPQVLRLRTNG
jgi:hypothetical protein